MQVKGTETSTPSWALSSGHPYTPLLSKDTQFHSQKGHWRNGGAMSRSSVLLELVGPTWGLMWTGSLDCQCKSG